MNRKKIKILLTAYYLAPLAVVALAYVVNPTIVSDPFLWAALIAGVLGYSWLMIQLVLSARLKWLERGIGQDRLLIFHRTMAPLSLILLIVHLAVKLWLYPASLQVVSGLVVFIGFALVGFVSAALFNGSSKMPLFALLQKLVYGKLRLQYHQMKNLHNGTFLLAVIMFLHVSGSSTAASSTVLRLYFILLFAISAAVYIYHKLLRPRMRSPIYRVVDVSRPSDQVTNVGFEHVKGRPVRHSPGQFAFYWFLKGVPGKEEHPFTISAGTDESVSGKQLSFTAKAIGDFTEALPQVEKGDLLKVNGPYGIFSYHFLNEQQPMVWIAGGIGITPFLSMARTLAVEKNPARPLLLWNTRRPEDFIYLEELKASAEVVQLLDNQEAEWDGMRGRMTKEFLQGMLTENHLKRAFFFICGPPAMMAAVRTNLTALGVANSRMLWERFAL
ncbi:MAG: ferric reductase-like transmembrane domain-containing protein [Spirochaetota bacterium]